MDLATALGGWRGLRSTDSTGRQGVWVCFLRLSCVGTCLVSILGSILAQLSWLVGLFLDMLGCHMGYDRLGCKETYSDSAT
jgi:uncharacterized membrane protein